MKIFKNILSAVASAKAENRQKVLMVSVLVFAFAFTATAAFAALTLTTTTVSSDGALTVDSAAALNLGTSTATSVSIGSGSVSSTFNGPVVFAANKGVTVTSGTSAFDLSGGSGVFKTTTGVNTISGATVFAANKGVTVTAGTSAFDFSGGTGVFKTSTGANTLSGPVDQTRTLTSQSTENNNLDLSLTTDSTFVTGTNISYSGGRGSALEKLTGTWSATTGGYSNLYSLVNATGALNDANGGPIGVKGVTLTTAALTAGNVYGGQFIAKHNHATNKAANAAALIGVEGVATQGDAGQIGTAIGGSFAIHIPSNAAVFDGGAVHRGVQITMDNASSNNPSESTGLAIWNMTGTQTNAIKVIKSSSGFTNDLVLQNSETINNSTDGLVLVGGDFQVTPVYRAATDSIGLFKIDATDKLLGTTTRTYAQYIYASRPNGTTMTAGQDDAALRLKAENMNGTAQVNYVLRAATMEARNDDSPVAGNVGTLEGVNIGANQKGTAIVVRGLTVSAENYGTISGSGTFGGIDVNLTNEGAVAATEYGIRIRNLNNSLATAVTDAILIADSGANIGWTYGLDTNGATINTADIRLHSGNTIDNPIAGVLSSSAALVKLTPATAGGTNTYTSTIAISAYATGQLFLVTFTNASTTTASLNVNSLGAAPLYALDRTQIATSGKITAGSTHLLLYDAGHETAGGFVVLDVTAN